MDPNQDLAGKQFKSPRHANDVVWTVLHYHRGGAWVCQENKHDTTCEFYDSELWGWIEEFEKAN